MLRLLVLLCCVYAENRVIFALAPLVTTSHTIYSTSAELCDLIAEVFVISGHPIHSYRYGDSSLYEIRSDSLHRNEYMEARGCVFESWNGEQNAEMVTLLPVNEIHYCMSTGRNPNTIFYTCLDMKGQTSVRIDEMDIERGTINTRWCWGKDRLCEDMNIA